MRSINVSKATSTVSVAETISGETDTTLLDHCQRNGWMSLKAYVSFLVGVVVLIVYGKGVQSSFESLSSTEYGVDGKSTAYAGYTIPFMASFVLDLQRNASAVQESFQSTLLTNTLAAVAYLVLSTLQ
ncbi:hypothetical protein DYB37_007993 [Aphanomyces astaci]|uniref:Uncharacterized protein n=1 Tax=Aphanomyces astaci TaxID=112090 RepID=A0A3R7B9K4_APHAT|nr:hypothetical protein DYB35_008204 [Aphanomyces astaci]RHZ18386.1 hypothetical protein DYB37_007993 [Aphanomyces astaci]